MSMLCVPYVDKLLSSSRIKHIILILIYILDYYNEPNEQYICNCASTISEVPVEVGSAILEDSRWPSSPLAVRRHSSWATGKWGGVPSKNICQNNLIVVLTRFVVTSDNYVFCFTDRNKVILILHCVVSMVFMVNKYLKIGILG